MLQEETLFKNFSDEHFAWKFDGVEYEFKAGEVKPMTKAEALHFAKHLVDREMLRDKIKTNDASRPTYEAKATEKVSVTIHTEPEEAENGEEIVSTVRFCDSCDSKGKRHLKGCSTLEEVFEGLKDGK